MDLLLQWLLFAVAVAAGWGLGRFGRQTFASKAVIDDEEGLRERLKFLFTNYSDEAIESFVQSLPVNRDTVSLHLSIGTHFRDRGEVSRAILVHQNLLARPELPERFSAQVSLELGQDYLAAGLHDRAEALLQQLLGSREGCERAAVQLIDLYQSEREWSKARDVAIALVRGCDRPELRRQLAYLLCEEAASCIKHGDQEEARRRLNEALTYYPACVRAYLLLSEIEAGHARWREARNTLFRIFEQNPAFSVVAVNSLVRLAEQEGSERKLPRRLEKLYSLHPG
ncbi:MAG: tetratricopeptide repeat protein, partial [Gammaproteobacteria bacterium]|nr:tetratricopeptide repeat protein [Gammaproteobacteria bacterium]